MIRAILFDMGGTLDGDGQPWLDRFAGLYEEAGAKLPREIVRAAFDHAERCMAADASMAVSHLDEMIDRHLGWQLDRLCVTGSIADSQRRDLEAWMLPRFIAPIRAAGIANAPLLADLKAQGFQLGVVSNACGNVDRLCDDLGYSRYLSFVIDSHRVGIAKPDPAIYRLAVDRLGLPPAVIMMVGDSFERDMVPAKAIGMTTAWLRGTGGRSDWATGAVDVVLERLADLRTAVALQSRTVA
jgi:FMN phosphatase YigB (HAD superfamily)